MCLSLLQRAYPASPALLHTRILFLATLGMGYLCFAHYSASMTSILTVDVFQPDIASLEDVLDKGYQISVWTGTSYEMIFKLALPHTTEVRIRRD